MGRAVAPMAICALLVAGCDGGSVGSNRDTGPSDAGGDAGSGDASRPLDAEADGHVGDVDAGGEDAGATDGAVSPELCSDPAGNLIDGTFEGGMDGLVPVGWQVRDPGAPDRCRESGAPAEHVYVTDPAPGCGGQALAIDALGQWDCYAVQYFTDYSTIEGGRTYRVSASVRSEGQENPAAWFVVGVQWLDGSDAVFGDEKNPESVGIDYDWKRVSFELVAPAEARRAVVWLTAHYPGRVVYDNVAIRPVD